MAEKEGMELTHAAIINEHGNSKKNKTGSWRTLKPVVIYSKCTGCGTCAQVCPEGCIKIIKKKSNINYDYCKGCGICAKECPQKAIYMEKEEK